MRNLFYGIICFYLLTYITFDFIKDRQTEQENHKTAIVLSKDKHFLLDEYMILKYPNDSTTIELVYQIFYDKYNVGDTIK